MSAGGAPPDGVRPALGAAAPSSARATAVAYARGAVGGLIVAMPLLVTMEMWWGGFLIPAERLALLVAFNYGVLYVLQHYSGLHPRKTYASQARAAAAAYGIGMAVSLLTLLGMNVVGRGTAGHDLLGKLVLEAVPVSIGASVAMSQFGAENEVAEKRKEGETYWGAMAMALAGAMFFGFSVAATEEPMMLGLRVTSAHGAALVVASVLLVHLVVYSVEFRRRAGGPGGRRWWQLLLKEGVSAYALSLLVAAYLLWTFGRIGADVGWIAARDMVVVLGVATSLGAAAGELLI
jgi:putative integral membrane protein (TIGR02587 family)